ncbi:MAG: hypothetical protein GY750_12410 [Lentisphaerae bacterium]|nr:hypothetical protein [Lentisphaerota bacterium]MCP4102215.1 hypothetical protein [Lentisphaerota bacterium]
MKTSRYLIAIALLISVFACTLLSGCNTEAEKRGYSSIPQNYPATWEQQQPMGN